MQESYRKGIANHPGPESCVIGHKACHEALTGVQAGWVLSREILLFQGADAVRRGGRQQRWMSQMRDTTPLRGRRPQTCLETLCARTGRDSVGINRRGAVMAEI